MTIETQASPEEYAGWQKLVAQYQRPDVRKSVWQLVNSFGGYFLFLVLMYLSLRVGYWLTLLLALPVWMAFDLLSPGKLAGMTEMMGVYPKALLMSVLTPWGWLMYGGLILMSGEKQRTGMICTLMGAVILALFLPIWSTYMIGV